MVNRMTGWRRWAWVAVLAGALCATQASAATCRSGAAAAQGGQVGYQIDIRKADETEQQDRASSDILGRCVGSVTGILTIPTFPSLMDIFNRIKDEICRIASAQVHQAVGSVSGQINDAMNDIPGHDGSVIVPVPVTPPPGMSTAPATDSSRSLSDYWQRIWR